MVDDSKRRNRKRKESWGFDLEQAWQNQLEDIIVNQLPKTIIQIEFIKKDLENLKQSGEDFGQAKLKLVKIEELVSENSSGLKSNLSRVEEIESDIQQLRLDLEKAVGIIKELEIISKKTGCRLLQEHFKTHKLVWWILTVVIPTIVSTGVMLIGSLTSFFK